jgi:hypothetical protein
MKFVIKDCVKIVPSTVSVGNGVIEDGGFDSHVSFNPIRATEHSNVGLR